MGLVWRLGQVVVGVATLAHLVRSDMAPSPRRQQAVCVHCACDPSVAVHYFGSLFGTLFLDHCSFEIKKNYPRDLDLQMYKVIPIYL